MRVFVAGASGAIGRQLLPELVRQGHIVTGMRRDSSSFSEIEARGVRMVAVDAFDYGAVRRALAESGAEAVIDELTALPRTPAEIPQALTGFRRLLGTGGGNLLRAATAAGIKRYIRQSGGFCLAPGPGPGKEDARLATDAGGCVGFSASMYEDVERQLFSSGVSEGIALRYGFFYGPGTWYHPEGASADQVRNKRLPIIGDGNGVWSFVHVEDAARATVAALTAEPGTYNVVDSDPLPVAKWLPAFARWVDAPAPEHVSVEEALAASGSDAVFYGTQVRGASNEKAKRILGFAPRTLEWLREK